MPNWCANSLTVTGPDAAAFTARLAPADDTGKIPGLLSTFVPVPEELHNYSAPVRAENGEDLDAFAARVEHCRAAYGAEDRYDWCACQWGTNRDTDADRLSDTSWTFDTAWLPPRAWLESVSAMFPDATFTLAFCESGVESAGVLTMRAGDTLSQTWFDGDWYLTDGDDDDDDYDVIMSEDLQAFIDDNCLPHAGR